MTFAHPGTRRYSPQAVSPAHSKFLLVAALFFVLAGNIPPTGGFSIGSDGSTALVRGAGLAAGAILLLTNLLQQGSSGIRRILFFLTPFLVFLGFCMISAAWSLDSKATIIRSAESFFTVIFCGLWTHAAVRVVRSERELCSWIALAILGFVVYGILVNTVLFGHPIRMAISNEDSVRARFVFGGLHPLGVGDILAIGCIAAVWSNFRVLQKLGLLLLFMPLLVLTDATGARILVTVIFAMYVAVHLVNRIGIGRLVVLSVPFGIVAGLTVAITFSAESPFARLADNRMLTLTGRTELWSVIWESGLATTWFGTGFDAARVAISDIFGIAYQAHNQYLSILVELGYAGMFVFIAVFVVWLIPVVQSRNLVAWSFALYVIAINMNNASMFTKTWLIFATVLCYIMPLERMVMQAYSRQVVPVRRRRFRYAEPLAQ